MSLGLHARVSLQNNASRWNRWFNSVWTSLASLDNAKLFSQLIVFLPVIYKSSDYSTVSPIPGLVSGHLSPELVKWKGVLMSFSMTLQKQDPRSFISIQMWFKGILNLKYEPDAEIVWEFCKVLEVSVWVQFALERSIKNPWRGPQGNERRPQDNSLSQTSRWQCYPLASHTCKPSRK